VRVILSPRGGILNSRTPVEGSGTRSRLRVRWVAFGGGALAAEGIRDDQRKFIKYNHFVANLLIFHNVVTMSKAMERLAADGPALVCGVRSHLTLYLSRHGAPANAVLRTSNQVHNASE
jgi:hypothetical protein